MTEIRTALDATLTYTRDDDGVWLELGDQEVNLGYSPTLAEALNAAVQLDDAQKKQAPPPSG